MKPLTEVRPTYCKECGSLEMKWTDIAQAMEEMIDVAPTGIKPMFRQAIDEIRKLRTQSWPSYPIVTTYEGIDLKDLYRDAMSYRHWRASILGEKS